MEQITLNYTAIQVPQYRDMPIQYVTETHHAFSIGEIIFIIGIFAFLTYWLIKVRQNREYYEHWKNPNGREVNLYKIINITFYAFIGVVIIGGILQILLTKMYGG